MALPQIGTRVEPQIIPTNAGLRTFAAPPSALQDNIVPNDLFYVRNHWKDCPEIDLDTYRLRVDGQVDRELSLSMEDLRRLPQKRFQVTFECCGNSPVPEYYTKSLRISSVMEQIKGHGIMGNAEWAGVSLRDVLELAGVKDNAVEVMFEGADHGPDEVVGDPAEVVYERSLPMAKALHPDTLLAYEMNGEPLPIMHGRPLRLLVSGWYGMNSVKWLVGIHVLDHEFKGFYMTERYMTQNEPGSPIPYTYYTRMKVKSVITNPVPGEIIPAAGYRLAGAAWSGEQEITKVEFSDDGGESWTPVDVVHPRAGYSWYRWEHHWNPPAEGKYTIMCRATNDLGETQPMEFPNKWDGRGYGNNMVFPRGSGGRKLTLIRNMPAPFVFVAVIVLTVALIIFFGAWAVASDAEGRELTFGLPAASLEDAGTEGDDQARAAFGVAPIGETSEGAADTWWGKGFLKACPLH